MLAGHHEIAAYLLEYGATKIVLSPADAFMAACASGRRDEALAMLKDHPAQLEKLGPHGRVDLPHRAMRSGRPESVRLKLLIELGADPEQRDPTYGGTPGDWAAHN